MDKKDLKKFNITVMGEKILEGYTENSAIANFEKQNPGMRAYSFWYVLGLKCLENLSSFVTLTFAAFLLYAYVQILNTIEHLPYGFNILGICVWFILILTTMRLPLNIGSFFEYRMR